MARHPAVKAFELGVASQRDVVARAYWEDDFGLKVWVMTLPEWAWNPARLAGADGGPHPSFTRDGETLWALLRDLGERALIEAFKIEIPMHRPTRPCVAIVLSWDAIDHARRRVADRRIAA